jgi:hypothetical protein
MFIFVQHKHNNTMQLQKATKSKVKLKIALQGTSGSGKTYSALQLAYGITADWTKIAVIDTENESSNYYANQGEFNVLSLQAPFTPDRYLEAIQACIKAGMECIIIDSITHEWDGIGGILEMHEKATRNSRSGNSFNAWASITPLHNKFVQFIVDAPVHIIGTLRTKSDYVLQDRNGKQVPVKVGMKAITRDGMEYEFGIGFEIDLNHTATCSKDRTGLFVDAEPFVITPATGQKLVEWANTGVDAPKTEPAPQPAPKAEVLLSERIDKLKDAFDKLGVTNEQLSAYAHGALGKDSLSELDANDLDGLASIYKEIKQDTTTIDKYFI